MKNKESVSPTIQDILALIPAYNPDKGMITLVEELAEHFLHIVIVDDGCGETFAPIFEKVSAFPQVKILKHEENKGKGRISQSTIRMPSAWSRWMRTGSIQWRIR